MKILVDELPSHPNECIFSTSYWDYDVEDYVCECNLSKSGCNFHNCGYLETGSKPEPKKSYYDLYLNG